MFNRDRSQHDRYEAPRQASTGQGYPWTAGAGRGAGEAAAGPGVLVAREGILTASFVWMFLALLASTASAGFVIANSATVLPLLGRWFLPLILVELGLVFAISLGINRLGAIPALALLFTYALLNGVTLSVVVYVYTAESILSAFLGAAAIFGGAALYGVVTKRDLTSLGGILVMGLVGLIVVSLVNVFLVPSTQLSWIIGIAGVVIFTGLTAYDVQRINNGNLGWIKTREGASVVGALALYLDFVNLFLMLLRVFGSSRD